MPSCPRGHPSDTDDFCDECGLPMDGPPMSSPSPSAPPPPSPSASEWASAAEWASASPSSGAGSGPPAPAPPASASGGGETCPWCGAPRNGRFCEEDGYDFVLAPDGPAPSPSAPSPLSTAAFGSPTASPGGADACAPASSEGGVATGMAPTGWVVRVEADRRYFDSVLERRGPDIETVTFPTYYPRTEVQLAGEEMRIGRRRASSATQAPEIDLSGPPLDPGISRLHAVLLAGPSGWSVLDPGSTNGTTINYADEPIATDTPIPVADGDRIHVGAYTTLVVVQNGS